MEALQSLFNSFKIQANRTQIPTHQAQGIVVRPCGIDSGADSDSDSTP